jgi:hypothetical protein
MLYLVFKLRSLQEIHQMIIQVHQNKQKIVQNHIKLDSALPKKLNVKEFYS